MQYTKRANTDCHAKLATASHVERFAVKKRKTRTPTTILSSPGLRSCLWLTQEPSRSGAARAALIRRGGARHQGWRRRRFRCPRRWCPHRSTASRRLGRRVSSQSKIIVVVLLCESLRGASLAGAPEAEVSRSMSMSMSTSWSCAKCADGDGGWMTHAEPLIVFSLLFCLQLFVVVVVFKSI